MGAAAEKYSEGHLRSIWTPRTAGARIHLMNPRNVETTMRAIHRMSSVAWNGRYIPHRPHAKQLAFLLLGSEEALYGGAAGGGKSDALLMAALQYVHIPGYEALILRRTFRQLSLPDAIMDRAKKWLIGKGPIWREGSKTFEFPSGARISFGYLANDADLENYQGSAYQFVGFDELTQFTAHQYSYMFSRLRRLKGVQIPLRIRGATNPGGVGHQWVKDRFVRPRVADRPYIPALMGENPGLDVEAYRQSLSRLVDTVTQKQLELGDWDIERGGNYFQRSDFIIDSLRKLGGRPMRWVRVWDLAGTEPSEENPDPDYTAGVLIGSDGANVYIRDIKHARLSPKKVERMITRTAKIDGPEVEIWIEQEPGSAGKTVVNHYRQTVLRGYTVRAFNPKTKKKERAKPFSAAVEGGDVILIGEGWDKTSFIDEAVLFDGTEKTHDDRIDAACTGYLILTRLGKGSGNNEFQSARY